MGHGHAHLPDVDQTGDGRLVGAIAINLLLTVAQIVGGVISGSLSLVADALHNLNDAASLGIALIARRIGRRPADKLRTYGYKRAEVIGALINTTTLIIVGIYLVYEAFARFLQPEPIDGWIVVIVAGIALVVDLGTAAMTFTMAKRNLNIKAAFLHNVADALGSLVVIFVGIVVLAFQWYVADLIATLLLAAYILVQGYRLMGESIRILMDSVPQDLDLDRLVTRMKAVSGVHGVHHVHVRHIDEHKQAIEAHVVVQEGLGDSEGLKKSLKSLLREEFSISHATLEIESRGGCTDDGGSCS
ncbi:MAG: cation diffusion facilitator family transporter [Candidatus Krumholzibacteriia bacterium]